jgi:hypothetical protein
MNTSALNRARLGVLSLNELRGALARVVWLREALELGDTAEAAAAARDLEIDLAASVRRAES